MLEDSIFFCQYFRNLFKKQSNQYSNTQFDQKKFEKERQSDWEYCWNQGIRLKIGYSSSNVFSPSPTEDSVNSRHTISGCLDLNKIVRFHQPRYSLIVNKMKKVIFKCSKTLYYYYYYCFQCFLENNLFF